MADTTPEIRLSPDGRDVAIRNSNARFHPWRVTNGDQYTDAQVAGWLPLVDARHRGNHNSGAVNGTLLQINQVHGQVGRG